MTNKSLKARLREIKGEEENALIKAVITDLMSSCSTSEELETHMKDILTHGCVSGAVSSLIYYVDTEKFFKKFCCEIVEMLQEVQEQCGTPVSFELTPNNLSWFAYEEITRNLYNLVDDNL